MASTSTSSTDSLAPVSREQAFLESFFQCLNKNVYDKAKDLCDRERELQKSCGSGIWLQFLASLSQLSITEKSYTSLMYLTAKWFSNKNTTLRPTLQVIQSDLKNMQEQQIPDDAEKNESSLSKIVIHLSGQLTHFITARIKMMDFYEQVATMGTHRLSNHEDLLVVITEIFNDHNKSFHHPILSQLRSSFLFECEVLINLLTAQICMTDCSFMQALLHLSTAHARLNANASAAPPKESRKLSFAIMKQSPQSPALHQWLRKFLALLLAKFTLFNYDILSKQGSDMKTVVSKNSLDLYTKVRTFQHKSDALCVAGVLDTSQVSHNVQQTAGYLHPKRNREKLTGIDSYHPVFCIPSDRPDKHWPDVVNLIIQRRNELENSNKVTYFCDLRNQTTFFMAAVEQRLTMVLIFESKKSERDSYVCNFLAEIIPHLRCSKFYLSLRPGAK